MPVLHKLFNFQRQYFWFNFLLVRLDRYRCENHLKSVSAHLNFNQIRLIETLETNTSGQTTIKIHQSFYKYEQLLKDTNYSKIFVKCGLYRSICIYINWIRPIQMSRSILKLRASDWKTWSGINWCSFQYICNHFKVDHPGGQFLHNWTVYAL